MSHERAPGTSLAQPWKWGAQVCGNRERDGDPAATRSPAEHEALSKMDKAWEDEPRPCTDLPGAVMGCHGWEPLKYSPGPLQQSKEPQTKDG